MHRVKDLEWAVNARCQIQGELLRLYKFVAASRKELEKREEWRRAYERLVGASFSLWRAAFLCSVNRSPLLVFEDTIRFLERLLETNAIAFTQDFDMRGWSAGHYINNAKARLIGMHRGVDENPLHKQWESAMQLLTEQISNLQKEVFASAGSRRRSRARLTKSPRRRNSSTRRGVSKGRRMAATQSK